MKLPTQEECANLVQNSEAFQCIETEVNGFKIQMYNYLLASYKDFFPDNGDVWTELRGLTFVYNTETDEWERHLLLTKFFNLGECSGPDLYELEFDNGFKIKVTEDYIFKLKDGSEKTLHQLTKNDEIISF
jgi:hypothetical protein